jgi:hypothetical protein
VIDGAFRTSTPATRRGEADIESIEFTATVRRLGIWSASGAALLGVAYGLALAIGLLSLTSQQQPIGDPLFTILEILIIVMAPVMVAVMAAVQPRQPSMGTDSGRRFGF